MTKLGGFGLDIGWESLVRLDLGERIYEMLVFEGLRNLNYFLNFFINMFICFILRRFLVSLIPLGVCFRMGSALEKGLYAVLALLFISLL